MDLHRPVLRPGVRLVRRYDGRWQACGPGRVNVLLDDAPGMSGLASALSHPWQPLPDGFTDQVAALAPLLVESDTASVLPTDPAAVVARAALVAEHGDGAPAAAALRAEAQVRVSGPAPWAGHAQALLAAAGVGMCQDQAEVRLLVHVGEPAPRLIEEVAREEVPHVWAGVVAGVVCVGPFVDPGRTACRQCVTTHLDDREHGFALTRRQYATPAGVPEPADPARLLMAVAWAVADVVAWVDGRQPSTWSTTVVLDSELDPVRERWRRHPRCGCSWSEAWLARLA